MQCMPGRKVTEAELKELWCPPVLTQEGIFHMTFQTKPPPTKQFYISMKVHKNPMSSCPSSYCVLLQQSDGRFLKVARSKNEATHTIPSNIPTSCGIHIEYYKGYETLMTYQVMPSSFLQMRSPCTQMSTPTMELKSLKSGLH